MLSAGWCSAINLTGLANCPDLVAKWKALGTRATPSATDEAIVDDTHHPERLLTEEDLQEASSSGWRRVLAQYKEKCNYIKETCGRRLPSRRTAICIAVPVVSAIAMYYCWEYFQQLAGAPGYSYGEMPPVNKIQQALQILGLKPCPPDVGGSGCHTQADIRQAYRTLAKIYHPDKPTRNEELFIKISAACKFLRGESAEL